MTYCVGMILDEGLVMLADSRTNAGVDHLATFRKLRVWSEPGERVIALASSGNLAITQAVLDLVGDGIAMQENADPETMLTVPTMRDAAKLVGKGLRMIEHQDGEALRQQGMEFSANFLLGGQMKDGKMRLFHIYAAGNYIEATDETPFFQIGETKYGKPVLDRIATHAISLEQGVKLALISMDSTLRSNISVGLPLDVLTVKRDAYKIALQHTITENDAYFKEIQKRWGRALRGAFDRMPNMMPKEVKKT